MEALFCFGNGDVLLSSNDSRRLRNIFINVVDRIRFGEFEERQCTSMPNTLDVIWVEYHISDDHLNNTLVYGQSKRARAVEMSFDGVRERKINCLKEILLILSSAEVGILRSLLRMLLLEMLDIIICPERLEVFAACRPSPLGRSLHLATKNNAEPADNLLHLPTYSVAFTNLQSIFGLV